MPTFGPISVVGGEVQTGVTVQPGAILKITSTGLVDFGGAFLGTGAPILDANGDSRETPADYPAPNLKKNSLIFRIGVGKRWFQGGNDVTIKVPFWQVGEIILRTNDNNVQDNSRGWAVTLDVTLPAQPQPVEPFLPAGLKAKLVGNLSMTISAQDNMITEMPGTVALDLDFSADFSIIKIGDGWPTIQFGPAAPLTRDPTTLRVKLIKAGLGTFDTETGTMKLPLTLHLDYNKDYLGVVGVVGGVRDQNIDLTLSSKYDPYNTSLWEDFPDINLFGRTSYTTRFTHLDGGRDESIEVRFRGEMSPSLPIPLPTTYRPAVCSLDPDRERIDLFVRGSNNAIWYRTYIGSAASSEWLSLGGDVTSDPAAVHAGLGTQIIYVFARFSDNALHVKELLFSQTGIQQSDWTSLGGVLTSSPAACAFGPDRLVIFVRGIDNAIWFKTMTRPASSTEWKPLGGIITSDPSAMAMGDAAYVFGRGTDNVIYYNSKRGASDWSGWKAVPSNRWGRRLASAAAACSVTPDRNEFFVFAAGGRGLIGANISNDPNGPWAGSIYSNVFKGNVWSQRDWWQEPGNETLSDLAAVAMNGKPWVFGRGDDGIFFRIDYRTNGLLDGSIPPG